MANVPGAPLPQDSVSPMSTIIVSYDGTTNDDDALALGKLLAETGASLALAYVRHSREFDPQREEIAEHDAERRLAQGAAWLEDPDLPQHIVTSASTGEGLGQLAESEGASLIVFGSDYRTPPGRVEPGTSAQHLLEGGTIAVAVAPAGLRTHADASIESIALASSDGETAAQETAAALAAKLGAKIVEPEAPLVDLIIAASQNGAPEGRIALGGATRAHLDAARSAVIVLPRGKPALI
jgi:nucleotide-binding universal stress UspA family protein